MLVIGSATWDGVPRRVWEMSGDLTVVGHPDYCDEFSELPLVGVVQICAQSG